jgi:hypothetical protein
VRIRAAPGVLAGQHEVVGQLRADAGQLGEGFNRVFGAAARPPALPPEIVLLWNRMPVQSIEPAEYPVIGSRIPLCR